MFAKLMKVLIPPCQPRETASEESWLKLENSQKLYLPSDYKEFIRTYGTGWIGHFIIIWNPFANNSFVNFNYRKGEFLREVALAKQARTDPDIYQLFPYTFYPENSGLLPFGSSINGDIFFWETEGNSKEWNVVINRTRSSIYEKHNWGLSDFLFNLQNNNIYTFINDTNFDPALGFQQRFIE